MRGHRTVAQEDLIRLLNPVIRGWSHYYRTVVAKVTFQDCEQIRELLTGYRLKAVTRSNGIGNNGKVRRGRVYREVIVTSERDERAIVRREKSA